MTISPERRQEIVALAQLLGRQDVDTSGFSHEDWLRDGERCWSEALAFVRAASPGELQVFVENWNWDEDPGMMQEIASLENCDAGTALMVYWRSAPEWYRQFKDRDAASLDGNLGSGPMWDLQSIIETRFANADFKTANISFDPASDDGLPMVGVYDDFQHKFVRDLPAVMYEPVEGS